VNGTGVAICNATAGRVGALVGSERQREVVEAALTFLEEATQPGAIRELESPYRIAPPARD
jgi:hypothetical protein